MRPPVTEYWWLIIHIHSEVGGAIEVRQHYLLYIYIYIYICVCMCVCVCYWVHRPHMRVYMKQCQLYRLKTTLNVIYMYIYIYIYLFIYILIWYICVYACECVHSRYMRICTFCIDIRRVLILFVLSACQPRQLQFVEIFLNSMCANLSKLRCLFVQYNWFNPKCLSYLSDWKWYEWLKYVHR